MSASPCRAFEERLMARLELDAKRPIPVDPHAAECSACASLLEEILAHSALFSRLARPDSPELLARLAKEPDDFAARRAAAPVLDLLEPGRLRVPEPSRELLARIVFLPTRAARGARSRGEEPLPASFFGRLRVLFGDWRVTVAAAYAVTLVFVTVLKVDPLSVARETASGLGAAGERAIAEAKENAMERLADSSLAKAAAPMKSRFEYRLYRSVTAARARATAYSQLLFEKVFGGTVEPVGERAEGDARDEREPHDPALRS